MKTLCLELLTQQLAFVFTLKEKLAATSSIGFVEVNQHPKMA